MPVQVPQEEPEIPVEKQATEQASQEAKMQSLEAEHSADRLDVKQSSVSAQSDMKDTFSSLDQDSGQAQENSPVSNSQTAADDSLHDHNKNGEAIKTAHDSNSSIRGPRKSAISGSDFVRAFQQSVYAERYQEPSSAGSSHIESD